VLGLIAGGLQSGGIAERLVLSTDTIKTHAENAMAKLGAHTRAHAVALALSTGQINFHGDRDA
jgi:DNA-binding NarL/FixJ family response regulator